MCYVASLRCGAELLGITNYFPDVCLESFLRKYTEVKLNGVTRHHLTYLMQMCNRFQKKAKKKRLTFNGK